jgi:oligopeptide transport system permease protein
MQGLDIPYLAKKLFYMLSSLFIIITLTFFLMKVIPGDPFGEEQGLPKEIHEALRRHYGLDHPWYIQYRDYLAAILKGDFGPSFKYKDRTVNEIIREGFSVSALLGLEALLLALCLGVFLGVIAALKENKWQDNMVMIVTTIGISVPSFIFASLLQYVLALKLGLFPLARWGSFAQSILPSFALAALPMAFIARLTRSNLLEVLQTDYIKNARAKGLSQAKVIVCHALRNSLLPVLTYLGQLLANILVGSFIVEKIFSIPGLGQWFVNSVNNRDYTVIMGLTIFYSILLMSAIFLIEIAYGFLDPRIKLQQDKTCSHR